MSSSPKGTDSLTMLLKSFSSAEVSIADCGSGARRAIGENEYDIIIINAPLSDEFGHELAIKATTDSSAGVVIICKTELSDNVSSKVEDYGVFVVSKPLNRQLFYQALKLVTALRNRILGFQKENRKLQTKIEEIRLVDRAKCALIEHLGMTEPEAHRRIEKQAMDTRSTRREVAREILDAADRGELKKQ